MTRRPANQEPTAGDRAEPIAEGCVAHNDVADVLEVMEELGVELMPVLRSFAGGEILGIVHRVALEKAGSQAGAEGATVAEAWWFDAPRVRADVPVSRILEAPHRAHLYLVVDAEDRPLGVLRPDGIEPASTPREEGS